MKKVILVFVLAVLLAFLAIFLKPSDQVKESSSQHDFSGEWLSYRGDSALTGQAGFLADSYRVLWKAKVGAGVSSSPVIAGNLVVVADEAGVVSAFDRRTGKVIWSFASGNSIEAPLTVFDKRLLVGNLSGDFFCLDLLTGKELWKYQTGEQIYGGASIISSKDKSLVVFGSYDFFLHALDLQNGKDVWRVKSGNYIHGTAAVDEVSQTLLFGGCDAKLRVVDYKAGKQSGFFRCDSYLPASPAVGSGVAYVGSHGGVLTAVDLNQNKALWFFKPKANSPFIASPALTENSVVIGNRDGNCFVVDRGTGKLTRSFRVRGEVAASPIVADDKVLLTDGEGWVTIFSLSTGKLIWEYLVGSEIKATPAVAGRNLLVCDSGGTVYMFRATDAED